MQHICTHCGLSSPDGNLWCQRSECSAGNLTNTLRRGERLGEIEVGTLLRFMRTAAVYEARRGEEEILLKVAHFDTQEDLEKDRGYARYLKNEANLLQRLALNGKQHPALPRLLPPYSQMNTIEQIPYGRIVFRDRLRYFIVYEHVQGQFLRDLLNDNPQPQHEKAAWMLLALADVIVMLHQEAATHHMALTPEAVLVRTDLDGYLRPMLFDLGLFSQPLPAESSGDTSQRYDRDYHEWLSRFLHPAYTAPELFRGRSQPSTDVYGLAVIFYEMLTGRPPYPYETKTEQMVRSLVLTDEPLPLNRPDLPPRVTEIVQTGMRERPETRFPSVNDLAVALQSIYGPVPPERIKREGWLARNRPALLMLVFVLLLFLIGLGIAGNVI